MISVEEIKKMAGLARIEIKDEEAEELAKEVGSILDYAAEVKEIAGGNSGEIEMGPVVNVLRDDDNPNEGGTYSKDLIAEFPNKEGDYLKVKKIL